MTTYQAIFHTANGKNGAFLYYVREPVTADSDEAAVEVITDMCGQLARRLGCAAKATVEVWDTPCRSFPVGPVHYAHSEYL